MSEASSKKIMFFTASWCEGCKTLKPHLEKVKEQITVDFVDVEERGDEAASYGVQSLPTLFFIRDDQLVSHRTGSSEATIKEVYRFVEN